TIGVDLSDNVKNSRLAETMARALGAYREGDLVTFNEGIEAYRNAIAEQKPAELIDSPSILQRTITGIFGSFYAFEAWFNRCDTFFIAKVLYIFTFLLGVLGLLIWRQPLSRAAFWLLVFTFALHTIALLARMYISGRPPVTNLYSSAVFIGWGCVLLAIILELIYRMGIGTIVGSVIGFLTLLVAYFLAADGDTFVVLQAVLDTQFWLATHVVAITLGYSTTFLAGGLGILYILFLFLWRVGLASQDDRLRDELPRMIYGVLCFAIFFSFVGTVLGGLWADDSWGRFWGWDPKENGALIIVLWNALVLHARWAGLVRTRGLAVLVVVGNIVTAWSWFGVNELGVGLHSYGFKEGVLRNLLIVVLSQLLIIVIGCLPLMRDGKKASASTT
ncbi:MAG: cytochrome c biogenesis protein CcsA, partial [Planctomycetota bacterium]|nr:cytochrome c biogenesis protein CcsA [Planctomycetota bacterium]